MKSRASRESSPTHGWQSGKRNRGVDIPFGDPRADATHTSGDPVEKGVVSCKPSPTIPNTLFGSFNPFAELIAGDWFHANDCSHHVGAVYLNGAWLTEAISLEDVLKPMTATRQSDARTLRGSRDRNRHHEGMAARRGQEGEMK